MVKRFTLVDAALIATLTGGAALFIPAMQSQRPETVAVYRDKTLLARYPLTVNIDFIVRGTLGPMRVRIENGAVRVLSASCPEQICVKTKAIRKTSRQIICEPNHVVLEIESIKTNSIDAVTQ